VFAYFRRHPWRLLLGLLAGTLLGVGLFVLSTIIGTFTNVADESFNPQAARAALEARTPDEVEHDRAELRDQLTDQERELIERSAAGALSSAELEEEILAQLGELRDETERFNPNAFSPSQPDDMFDAYLLLGADKTGHLADAIVLGLIPSDGSTPILVNIPRDLYLFNPCIRTWSRINTGLGGCEGVASGLEMMAVMIHNYTGIQVDHVARVDFAGFTRVVDALGGITICVDYETRDIKSQLQLPAGCTRADGSTTLAWARSRHTEQLIGEEWKQVVGSDFGRQRHQQEVMFKLAAKVASLGSLSRFDDIARAVSNSVRLDSEWSLADAVRLAWKYRGITSDEVKRFEVQADNFIAPGGAQVLIPSVPFADLLAEVHAPSEP
jgi:LCP family protein required for cell wall assembly